MEQTKYKHRKDQRDTNTNTATPHSVLPEKLFHHAAGELTYISNLTANIVDEMQAESLPW